MQRSLLYLAVLVSILASTGGAAGISRDCSINMSTAPLQWAACPYGATPIGLVNTHSQNTLDPSQGCGSMFGIVCNTHNSSTVRADYFLFPPHIEQTPTLLCAAHLDSQMVCPAGTVLKSFMQTPKLAFTRTPCGGRLEATCVQHRAEFGRSFCTWMRGTMCNAYSGGSDDPIGGSKMGTRFSLFGVRGYSSDMEVLCCVFDATGANSYRSTNPLAVYNFHQQVLNAFQLVQTQGSCPSPSCAVQECDSPTAIIGLCSGSSAVCRDGSGSLAMLHKVICGGIHRFDLVDQSVPSFDVMPSDEPWCPRDHIATAFTGSKWVRAASLQCRRVEPWFTVTDRCVSVERKGTVSCPAGFVVVAARANFVDVTTKIRCCYLQRNEGGDGMRVDPFATIYPYFSMLMSSSLHMAASGNTGAFNDFTQDDLRPLFTYRIDTSAVAGRQITAITYSPVTDTIYFSVGEGPSALKVKYFAGYQICAGTVRAVWGRSNAANNAVDATINSKVTALAIDPHATSATDQLYFSAASPSVKTFTSTFASMTSAFCLGTSAPYGSGYPPDGHSWASLPNGVTALIYHSPSNRMFAGLGQMLYAIDTTSCSGSRYFGAANSVAPVPATAAAGAMGSVAGRTVVNVTAPRVAYHKPSNSLVIVLDQIIGLINLNSNLIRVIVGCQVCAGAAVGTEEWELQATDSLHVVDGSAIVAASPTLPLIFFTSTSNPAVYSYNLDTNTLRHLMGNRTFANPTYNAFARGSSLNYLVAMAATDDAVYILRGGAGVGPNHLIHIPFTNRRAKPAATASVCTAFSSGFDTRTLSNDRNWACPAPTTAATQISATCRPSTRASGLCVTPPGMPASCSPCALGPTGAQTNFALRCTTPTTADSSLGTVDGTWTPMAYNDIFLCADPLSSVVQVCISANSSVPQCPPGVNTHAAAVKCGGNDFESPRSLPTYGSTVDWYEITRRSGHRQCAGMEEMVGLCIGSSCPRPSWSRLNASLVGAIACRHYTRTVSAAAPVLVAIATSSCTEDGQAIVGYAGSHANTKGELGNLDILGGSAYKCGGFFPVSLRDAEPTLQRCASTSACTKADEIIINVREDYDCSSSAKVIRVQCAPLRGGAKLLDCVHVEGDGLIHCPNGYAAVSLCPSAKTVTELSDVFRTDCGFMTPGVTSHMRCCRVGAPDTTRSVSAPTIASTIPASLALKHWIYAPVKRGFTMAGPLPVEAYMTTEQTGISVQRWGHVNTRGIASSTSTIIVRIRFYPRMGALLYNAEAKNYIGALQAEIAYGSEYHGVAFGHYDRRAFTNVGSVLPADATKGYMTNPSSIEIDVTGDRLFVANSYEPTSTCLSTVSLAPATYGATTLLVSGSCSGSKFVAMHYYAASNTLYLSGTDNYVYTLDVSVTTSSFVTVAGTGSPSVTVRSTLALSDVGPVSSILVQRDGSGVPTLFLGTDGFVIRGTVAPATVMSYASVGTGTVSAIVTDPTDANYAFVAVTYRILRMPLWSSTLVVPSSFAGVGSALGEVTPDAFFGNALDAFGFDFITDLHATSNRLYFVDRNDRFGSITLANAHESAPTDAAAAPTLFKSPSPDLLQWRCSAQLWSGSSLTPVPLTRVYGRLRPLRGVCIDAGETSANSSTCNHCGGHIRRTIAAMYHNPRHYPLDVSRSMPAGERPIDIDSSVAATRMCGYASAAGSSTPAQSLLVCPANTVITSVCISHPVFDIPRTLSNSLTGSIVDQTAAEIGTLACADYPIDSCATATGLRPSEVITCHPMKSRSVVSEACSWESALPPKGHQCSVGRVAVGICIGTACPLGMTSVKCCGTSVESGECEPEPVWTFPQFDKCPMGTVVDAMCIRGGGVTGCNGTNKYSVPVLWSTFMSDPPGMPIDNRWGRLVRCAGRYFIRDNAPPYYIRHEYWNGLTLDCPRDTVVTGFTYGVTDQSHIMHCSKLTPGYLIDLGECYDSTGGTDQWFGCKRGWAATGACGLRSDGYSGMSATPCAGNAGSLRCCRIRRANDNHPCQPGGATRVTDPFDPQIEMANAVRIRATQTSSFAPGYILATSSGTLIRSAGLDISGQTGEMSSAPSSIQQPTNAIGYQALVFFDSHHNGGTYWFWSGPGQVFTAYDAATNGFSSIFGLAGAGPFPVVAPAATLANAFVFSSKLYDVVQRSWSDGELYIAVDRCVLLTQYFGSTTALGNINNNMNLNVYYGTCAGSSAATGHRLSTARGNPAAMVYVRALLNGNPATNDRIYIVETVANEVQYIDVATNQVSRLLTAAWYSNWCPVGCAFIGIAHSNATGAGQRLYLTIGVACVFVYDLATATFNRAIGATCTLGSVLIPAEPVSLTNQRAENLVFVKPARMLFDQGELLILDQTTVEDTIRNQIVSVNLGSIQRLSISPPGTPWNCGGWGETLVSKTWGAPAFDAFAFDLDGQLTFCTGTAAAGGTYKIAARASSMMSYGPFAAMVDPNGVSSQEFAWGNAIECGAGTYVGAIDLVGGKIQCHVAAGYAVRHENCKWQQISAPGMPVYCQNGQVLTGFCLRHNDSIGCQSLPSKDDEERPGAYGAIQCCQLVAMSGGYNSGAVDLEWSMAISAGNKCGANMVLTGLSISQAGARSQLCSGFYFFMGAGDVTLQADATLYPTLRCSEGAVSTGVVSPATGQPLHTLMCRNLYYAQLDTHQCYDIGGSYVDSDSNTRELTMRCSPGYAAIAACNMGTTEIAAFGYCDNVTKYSMHLRCCRINTEYQPSRCNFRSQDTAVEPMCLQRTSSVVSPLAVPAVTSIAISAREDLLLRVDRRDGNMFVYDSYEGLRAPPAVGQVRWFNNSATRIQNAAVRAVLKKAVHYAVMDTSGKIAVYTSDYRFALLSRSGASPGREPLLPVDSVSWVAGAANVVGPPVAGPSSAARFRFVSVMAVAGQYIVAADDRCIFAIDTVGLKLMTIVDCRNASATIVDNSFNARFNTQLQSFRLKNGNVTAITAGIIPNGLLITFVHRGRVYQADTAAGILRAAMNSPQGTQASGVTGSAAFTEDPVMTNSIALWNTNFLWPGFVSLAADPRNPYSFYISTATCMMYFRRDSKSNDGALHGVPWSNGAAPAPTGASAFTAAIQTRGFHALSGLTIVASSIVATKTRGFLWIRYSDDTEEIAVSPTAQLSVDPSIRPYQPPVEHLLPTNPNAPYWLCPAESLGRLSCDDASVEANATLAAARLPLMRLQPPPAYSFLYVIASGKDGSGLRCHHPLANPRSTKRWAGRCMHNNTLAADPASTVYVCFRRTANGTNEAGAACPEGTAIVSVCGDASCMGPLSASCDSGVLCRKPMYGVIAPRDSRVCMPSSARSGALDCGEDMVIVNLTVNDAMTVFVTKGLCCYATTTIGDSPTGDTRSLDAYRPQSSPCTYPRWVTAPWDAPVSQRRGCPSRTVMVGYDMDFATMRNHIYCDGYVVTENNVQDRAASTGCQWNEAAIDVYYDGASLVVRCIQSSVAPVEPPVMTVVGTPRGKAVQCPVNYVLMAVRHTNSNQNIEIDCWKYTSVTVPFESCPPLYLTTHGSQLDRTIASRGDVTALSKLDEIFIIKPVPSFGSNTMGNNIVVVAHMRTRPVIYFITRDTFNLATPIHTYSAPSTSGSRVLLSDVQSTNQPGGYRFAFMSANTTRSSTTVYLHYHRSTKAPMVTKTMRLVRIPTRITALALTVEGVGNVVTGYAITAAGALVKFYDVDGNIAGTMTSSWSYLIMVSTGTPGGPSQGGLATSAPLTNVTSVSFWKHPVTRNVQLLAAFNTQARAGLWAIDITASTIVRITGQAGSSGHPSDVACRVACDGATKQERVGHVAGSAKLGLAFYTTPSGYGWLYNGTTLRLVVGWAASETTPASTVDYGVTTAVAAHRVRLPAAEMNTVALTDRGSIWLSRSAGLMPASELRLPNDPYSTDHAHLYRGSPAFASVEQEFRLNVTCPQDAVTTTCTPADGESRTHSVYVGVGNLLFCPAVAQARQRYATSAVVCKQDYTTYPAPWGGSRNNWVRVCGPSGTYLRCPTWGAVVAHEWNQTSSWLCLVCAQRSADLPYFDPSKSSPTCLAINEINDSPVVFCPMMDPTSEPWVAGFTGDIHTGALTNITCCTKPTFTPTSPYAVTQVFSDTTMDPRTTGSWLQCPNYIFNGICSGPKGLCDPEHKFRTGTPLPNDNSVDNVALLLGCFVGSVPTEMMSGQQTETQLFPICDEAEGRIASMAQPKFGNETMMALQCERLMRGLWLEDCHNVEPSGGSATHLRCPEGHVATGMCASDDRALCPNNRYAALRCCAVRGLDINWYPVPIETVKPVVGGGQSHFSLYDYQGHKRFFYAGVEGMPQDLQALVGPTGIVLLPNANKGDVLISTMRLPDLLYLHQDTQKYTRLALRCPVELTSIRTISGAFFYTNSSFAVNIGDRNVYNAEIDADTILVASGQELDAVFAVDIRSYLSLRNTDPGRFYAATTRIPTAGACVRYLAPNGTAAVFTSATFDPVDRAVRLVDRPNNVIWTTVPGDMMQVASQPWVGVLGQAAVAGAAPIKPRQSKPLAGVLSIAGLADNTTMIVSESKIHLLRHYDNQVTDRDTPLETVPMPGPPASTAVRNNYYVPSGVAAFEGPDRMIVSSTATAGLYCHTTSSYTLSPMGATTFQTHLADSYPGIAAWGLISRFDSLFAVDYIRGFVIRVDYSRLDQISVDKLAKKRKFDVMWSAGAFTRNGSMIMMLTLNPTGVQLATFVANIKTANGTAIAPSDYFQRYNFYVDLASGERIWYPPPNYYTSLCTETQCASSGTTLMNLTSYYSGVKGEKPPSRSTGMVCITYPSTCMPLTLIISLNVTYGIVFENPPYSRDIICEAPFVEPWVLYIVDQGNNNNRRIGQIERSFAGYNVSVYVGTTTVKDYVVHSTVVLPDNTIRIPRLTNCSGVLIPTAPGIFNTVSLRIQVGVDADGIVLQSVVDGLYATPAPSPPAPAPSTPAVGTVTPINCYPKQLCFDNLLYGAYGTWTAHLPRIARRCNSTTATATSFAAPIPSTTIDQNASIRIEGDAVRRVLYEWQRSMGAGETPVLYLGWDGYSPSLLAVNNLAFVPSAVESDCSVVFTVNTFAPGTYLGPILRKTFNVPAPMRIGVAVPASSKRRSVSILTSNTMIFNGAEPTTVNFANVRTEMQIPTHTDHAHRALVSSVQVDLVDSRGKSMDYSGKWYGASMETRVASSHSGAVTLDPIGIQYGPLSNKALMTVSIANVTLRGTKSRSTGVVLRRNVTAVRSAMCDLQRANAFATGCTAWSSVKFLTTPLEQGTRFLTDAGVDVSGCAGSFRLTASGRYLANVNAAELTDGKNNSKALTILSQNATAVVVRVSLIKNDTALLDAAETDVLTVRLYHVTLKVLETSFTVRFDTAKLLPRIERLTGCPLLVHPSVALCDPMSNNITVTGTNLASVANMSVRMIDGRLLPCTAFGRFALNDAFNVSRTALWCVLAGAYGQLLPVVLNAPQAGGDVEFARVTVSIVPGREAQCAFSPVIGRLCGRGICDSLNGGCVCDTNFTGASCDTCVASNYGPNCETACGGVGGVCSGRGTCDGRNGVGNCTCATGYAGSTCALTCAGGASNPCNGHGVCDRTSGACACFSNASIGFFANASCNACAQGYVGAACLTACPRSNNLVCNGHGACSDSGSCACTGGFCGAACEFTGGACTNCAAGFWGPTCTAPCPGGSSNPCNGHGVCDTSRAGTGMCACASGYGLGDCSRSCPGATSSPQILCGGHGTCAATGLCACDAFYAGPSCSWECPGLLLVPGSACNGHGTCADGVTGDGQCSCAVGWAGVACDTECPGGAATPCAGHGQCFQNATCGCVASTSAGYWTGANCSACAAEWYGPFCNRQCPRDASNGPQCGGSHGTCDPSSVLCRCRSDPTNGFWVGEACDECAMGYFGANCTRECPGGACTQCTGHGTCAWGRNNTGLCACAAANITEGLWGSADCSTCVSNVYGSQCTNRCPYSNVTNTYCGRGTCFAGPDGNGTCACLPGWAISSGSTVCEVCAAGFYGSSCTSTCPGFKLLNASTRACSSHGNCSDGLTGDGTCRCEFGYIMSDCSVRCPVANSALCGGHGACNSSGMCVNCSAGWQLDSTVSSSNATCSICKPGYYGPSCTQCPSCAAGTCDEGLGGSGACMCPADRWGPLCDKPCPRDPSGLVCGGHGVCRAIDGECDCFRDTRRGFWTGSLCSTCAATHANSPNCTLPCPIDNASQICSARGQCANGACRDCAPLASDGGVLVCGTACELRGDACRTNPCAVPKPGYWGANCTDVCPGGAATPCNNHGVCLSDGACSCQEGYSGIACDSLCARGSSGVLCSGHGACRTAGCVCDAPYYGTACSATCPGPVPTTADPTTACNGHSVTGGCESDGTCVCQLGYVGTECQYRCPGGSNPCNVLSGAGTCNSKTGKCECLNNATVGRYAGADCMSCTQGAAGPTCSDACNTLSGTTVGKLCVCNVGFGGPACDRECPGAVRDPILPKTVVGYCSQHGLCLDGSSNNATCACDANYYMTNCSVLCTADVCLSQGMTNSQCNATTGACECQDNFEGHYSGTACDACKLFYWGSTCALSCACSGNGGCDRDTGVCQCFQDDVRGHWGGDYCEACSAGYIGTQCTGLDIQMSSNANNSAYVTIEARGGGTAGSVYYMDDVTKFLFVGSYPVVVLNASVLPPTPLSAVPGGLDFGAPLVSIRAASASTLEVLVNHTGNATTAPTLERVIITRTTTDFTVISRTTLDFTNVALVRDLQSQHHAMRAQAAINGFEDATALFTLQYDTQTIILYDNLAAIVVAGSGSPSTFGVALPAELTAIYGARLDTNAQGQSVLVVSGTANSARYHGQTTWAAVITRLPLGSSNEWDVVNGNVDPISACDVDSKGRMPCPSARACTLFHTTSQTDRVVCVVAAPRGPTVLTVTHTATNHSLVTADPRTGRLVGAGRLNAAELLIEFAKPFEITAVAIDPVIDLGYIAFHTTDPTTGAEPSTVYKFSLSTLAPTGTYSFSRVGAEPEIVRSLTVLTDTRELHAIAVLPFRTTVRSLNLFGVERVIPSVIDAAGHVVITITGEGFFTSSNGVTSCIFDAGGNSTVAATIINSSMITCTAPRNEDDGTTCRIINFNVEFNSRRTDTTNAPIARPNSAKLSSLLTQYGDTGFGSTHLATAITVTGIGFIRSDFARCRLRESNGRVRVFSTAPTYLNSTSVVCYQPLNSLPTLPPAYLEYAHDGQIFSAVSVLYAVAGDASRIDVKRPASKVIAMISAAVAVVPAFEVHISDSNGNSLHWSADKPLGQGPYLARLSPSSGFGTGPTLTLANGTQSLEPTVNGVATFDTVFLRAPRAGSYQLDITVNGDGALWLDSVTIVVTPGIPSKLAIVNLAAVMSVKVGSAASSTVSPIIVVTDAAGNEIRAGTDRFDLPEQVMLEYDLAEEEVSGDGETKTAKSTAQKITADLSDGYFTFTAVPLRGFHGESYPLRFSAVVPAGVNAETHISSRIAPWKPTRCPLTAALRVPNTPWPARSPAWRAPLPAASATQGLISPSRRTTGAPAATRTISTAAPLHTAEIAASAVTARRATAALAAACVCGGLRQDRPHMPEVRKRRTQLCGDVVHRRLRLHRRCRPRAQLGQSSRPPQRRVEAPRPAAADREDVRQPRAAQQQARHGDYRDPNRTGEPLPNPVVCFQFRFQSVLH
jgi:hypothetical protein